MSSPQPIVIIGAGPSGLLLARYLEQNQIPVVVYEGDPSPDYRPQGGTLDLHEETGLLALKETNLLEDARSMMRSEGEAMKVVDKNGKVWLDENEDTGVDTTVVVVGEIRGRPEIDRTDLRNLLINSLSPTTIKWDHKITSITAISTTLYEINFVDKPSITTPYLVGADGTFSLVRPLLHSLKPDYSGISMYELEILPENLTEELERYIGKGALMILDESKALMPQMNSNRKCKIYLALKVPKEFLDQNPLPEHNKREYLCRFFQGWSGEARQIIMASQEDNIGQRRIYQYDPELTWDTDKIGVTVMGDAAHVMSPFAGEGVNQALADALLLGQTLVSLFTTKKPIAPSYKASLAPFPLSLLPVSSKPDSDNNIASSRQIIAPNSQDLYTALRKFEKQMMARAKVEMRGSKENMDMFFGDQPAKHLAEMLTSFAQGPPGAASGLGILRGIVWWPITQIKGVVGW